MKLSVEDRSEVGRHVGRAKRSGRCLIREPTSRMEDGGGTGVCDQVGETMERSILLHTELLNMAPFAKKV
jgi:hypothetical protein